jgi:thiosulfate/3-mercaptopyruvate sulfurtransferase
MMSPRLSKLWLILAVITVPMLGCSSTDEDAPDPQTPSNRLVSTAWLADHLDDPNVIVIDTRRTDEYLESHLPGAVSASFSPEDYLSHGTNVSYGGGLDLFLDRDADIPFQDGPPEQIQEAARSLGIDDDSTVIAYDLGPDFHAARFFFTLHSHGLTDIRVLDGGMRKWVAEERPTTTDVPQVERGDFTATEPPPEIIADTDYVLMTREAEDVKLVSGLLPSWHYGGYLAYSRPGHIPNTTHIQMGYFFRSDGTWKDPESIRALFEVMGVEEGDEIITYCGGNPLSACTYFTARFVLDYPHVRNYVGSMVAWIDDPRGLALDTYDNPRLLRDTDWIHWWAGERMQQLLQDPPARVIDVRPSGEHDESHIPESVNVPLDSGDDVLAMQPDAWAEEFGAVGIDRSIEAVVCDETVTPRATAMFWLLEYLGHPEVSVCSDGIEGWDSRYDLTSEPTLIAEAMGPLDVAVHPTVFTPVIDDTRAVDSAQTPRIDNRFSRTWVVASDTVPEGLPADEYVTIPASDHLDASGRVRSAWELWTLYDDAGVGKFTEIVVAAESVGDATVNYYALRLLGFPMVRVWVPGEGFAD